MDKVALIVIIAFIFLAGSIVGFALRDNNTLPDLNKTNINGAIQLDGGNCRYSLKDYNVAFIDKCGYKIGDKLKVVGLK